MQGSWNNGQPYYRCTFPGEYGLANRIDHPRVVYLREAEVVPELDTWLTKTLDPAHLPATLDALAAAQHDDPLPGELSIRQEINQCERQLTQIWAALDAGRIPQSSARGSQRHKPGSWPPRHAYAPNPEPALPHLGR